MDVKDIKEALDAAKRVDEGLEKLREISRKTSCTQEDLRGLQAFTRVFGQRFSELTVTLESQIQVQAAQKDLALAQTIDEQT